MRPGLASPGGACLATEDDPHADDADHGDPEEHEACQAQTTARYAHLMDDPVREAAGKVALGIAAAMGSQGLQ